jgi:hypothetical protein
MEPNIPILKIPLSRRASAAKFQKFHPLILANQAISNQIKPLFSANPDRTLKRFRLFARPRNLS